MTDNLQRPIGPTFAHQPDSSPREMVIIGAGTYGAVIAELAMDCGYLVRRFLDDDPRVWGSVLQDVAVSGPVEAMLSGLKRGTPVAVAIGDNSVRLRYLRLAREYGLATPALISPSATVSASATIEEGVYLHRSCDVWTSAWIRFGTIMSPQASVAHHTSLDEGCFVSTAANVGAGIEVGANVLFGINSTTSTGVLRIGQGTLIGAGAVIIRDTVPFGVYVGSPGRLTRVRRQACGVEGVSGKSSAEPNHQRKDEYQ